MGYGLGHVLLFIAVLRADDSAARAKLVTARDFPEGGFWKYWYAVFPAVVHIRSRERKYGSGGDEEPAASKTTQVAPE